MRIKQTTVLIAAGKRSVLTFSFGSDGSGRKATASTERGAG